ncbi:MAG: hypothetical protein Solumvirus2_5 [Solumvirus sp.]|uniref:Uncharacterized protein n=1 Tax=Solumvirus sp. TaxID=2487773 RepID=A0A3G5AGE0_9VIRU|nr:MAG: hypothetical protein Solumvirus2_5 [Solumvirus sp.]
METQEVRALLWGIFILFAIIVIGLILAAYKAQNVAATVKSTSQQAGNIATQVWQQVQGQLKTASPGAHSLASNILNAIAPTRFPK